MGGRGWGRKGWRINMFLGPYLVGPYLVEGCDFKTERWGMECKGRRTMKCCVFYCEEPTSSSSFFASRLVHSWSVCRGRASPDITPDLWNSQVGVEWWWWWWWEWWLWWSSSRSSPHVKMVKQRTSTPQHPPTPGRKNKKHAASSVSNESNVRLGDAWGQLLQMKVEINHRVAVWGPRRMVCRALSRTSYRHAVNYSPHFFPVLPSFGREPTRVQLWWLFQLRLKFSMFGDVLVFSFMAPLSSGICQS